MKRGFICFVLCLLFGARVCLFVAVDVGCASVLFYLPVPAFVRIVV